MQLSNQLRSAGAHAILDRIQEGAPSMLNLKSEISTVFLHYLCSTDGELLESTRLDLCLMLENFQAIIDAAYLEHRASVINPIIELTTPINSHATAC